MGFSVTASHVIILVTVLSGASVLGAKYVGVQGEVEEGERAAARLREEQVHTSLYVVDDATYPRYVAGPERFEVRIVNNGTTVLRLSEMEYFVDGAHVTSVVIQDTVDGDASTNLWMPGQVLEVWLDPITSSPAKFAAFAENGVGGYWRT